MWCGATVDQNLRFDFREVRVLGEREGLMDGGIAVCKVELDAQFVAGRLALVKHGVRVYRELLILKLDGERTGNLRRGRVDQLERFARVVAILLEHPAFHQATTVREDNVI